MEPRKPEPQPVEVDPGRYSGQPEVDLDSPHQPDKEKEQGE